MSFMVLSGWCGLYWFFQQTKDFLPLSHQKAIRVWSRAMRIEIPSSSCSCLPSRIDQIGAGWGESTFVIKVLEMELWFFSPRWNFVVLFVWKWFSLKNQEDAKMKIALFIIKYSFSELTTRWEITHDFQMFFKGRSRPTAQTESFSCSEVESLDPTTKLSS